MHYIHDLKDSYLTLQQAQQMDLFVNLVNAISSGALPHQQFWHGKAAYTGVLGPCVSLQLALDLIQNSVNSLQFCKCFSAIHAQMYCVVHATLDMWLQKNLQGGYMILQQVNAILAIPSRTTLQKIGYWGIQRKYYLGFINHTLDVACGLSDKGEHFVCSFDRKTLSVGSKGETIW